MGRVKRSRLLAACGVPVLAVAAAVSSVVVPSAAVTAAGAAAGTAAVPDVPVTHVIEVMLENHSFDNLFGSFAGADGIPANTSLLNPHAYFDSAPAVGPVWAKLNEGDVTGQVNNSTVGEQMAMDYQPGRGYLMDHYTVFPQDGMASITEFGPQFDPNEQYLASAYELADHNFQPVIAPTQPNVMTALNGTDHGWVYNNLEPGPARPWNSIFDELTAHGRSWKIYYALPPSALTGTIWPSLLPPDAADHHQPVRTARRVPPAEHERLGPVVHAEAVGPARADAAQRPAEQPVLRVQLRPGAAGRARGAGGAR